MASFHKILNRIESIKQKITDFEYKSLLDELQNEYKNKEKFYMIQYIEYIVESNSENTHIQIQNLNYPRQAYMNIGDECKSKIVRFHHNLEENKEYNELFYSNILNQEMIDTFDINKFIHFIDDSNPYSLSIIFIYGIELLN